MKNKNSALFQKRGIQYWGSEDVEAESSADLSWISAKWWSPPGSAQFSGSVGELLLTAGYDKICDLLSNEPGSPTFQVELEKNVTQVNVSGSVVTVSTSDKSWTADAVVVTVPLGVLKAQPSPLSFEPPLSQAKLAAVRGLGFGRFSKFFLYFNEVWWKSSVHYFGKAWGGEQDRGFLVTFLNAAAVSGTSKALVAISYGKGAERAEGKSDDELRTEAMAIIRTMNAQGSMHKDGMTTVPEPTAVLTHRWGTDPFARGAYSFPAVNTASPVELWEEMARPAGKLVFAGEHTTSKYWASVHGAWLSGERAAQDVCAVVPTPTCGAASAVPTPTCASGSASGSPEAHILLPVLLMWLLLCKWLNCQC